MQKHKIRVFDLIQYITGPLEGKIEDWPASIQDPIYAAVERLSKKVERPLMIVDSACGIDWDETEAKDRFFVQVIVSEVIAQDVGYEKRLLDEAMEQIKGKLH